MRIAVTAVLIAASSGLAAASSVAWLSYPGSARSLAQAGGLGVMTEGAESLGLNPAGLADLDSGMEAQVSYAQWPAEIDTQGGLIAFRSGDAGFGARFNYVDYGTVQGYNESLQADGSLHPSDYDAVVGAAWRFGDLALGAAGHWLEESLTPQVYGSSPAFEAGAKLGLSPRVVTSVSLLDAGSTLNGSGLPTSVRGGIMVQSLENNAWSAGLEASFPLAGGLQPDVYLAGRWQAAGALALFGGLGILGNNAGDFETLGASFEFRQLALDYGFRSAGAVGVVNELSLRLNV